MNRTEVAKLLTIASGFDRRQVDEMTVEAWHAIPALEQCPFEVARAVLIDHYANPDAGYFDVRVLTKALRERERTALGDVEADVRSAKARGLIGYDWPKREPLPPATAAALALARDEERQEAKRYLELGEAS